MIEVLNYNLPDIKSLEDNTDEVIVWRPDRNYIVLGASNTPENSLFVENVIRDGIPVLKRPSGGQTVLLTPQCIVISVTVTASDKTGPKELVAEINRILISIFEKTGVRELSIRGVSDITIHGKKISGSAVYKTRNKLFYHSVVNVNDSSDVFNSYLRHPSREPDYRQGRRHSDFITSLNEAGFTGDFDGLAANISDNLSASLSIIPSS